MSRPEYFVTHGPDRSHDNLESARFDRLKDAKEAVTSLGPRRYWNIVRISGGKDFTQQDVKVIATGGPDVERKKERERFKREYEESASNPRMSMREFIRSNREEIDAGIRRALGDPDYRLNDEERRQWIANDEGLYLWARSEGVRI